MDLDSYENEGLNALLSIVRFRGDGIKGKDRVPGLRLKLDAAKHLLNFIEKRRRVGITDDPIDPEEVERRLLRTQEKLMKLEEGDEEAE